MSDDSFIGKDGKELFFASIGLSVTAAVAYLCKILVVPNPNVLLFTVMVVCLAWKGLPMGIPSGFVSFLYSLYFFSTDNDFISFTGINRYKIITIAFGILINIAFVGKLHSKYMKIIKNLKFLNEALEREKERFEELSKTDYLTQLNNRHAYRVNFDLYKHKTISIVLFDIDHFKQFNDTYGHEIGDIVLKSVSAELLEIFKKENCYRLGGDEFLAIEENSDTSDLKLRISNLQKKLKIGNEHTNNLSIGVTCGYSYGKVETSEDLRHLMSKADKNLYIAKEKNRGSMIGTDNF